MIYSQVNNIFRKRHYLFLFSRYIQQECVKSARILHPLDSRKLLKVSGEDVGNFLQGLITNDMRHFEEGAKSIYSMFLNNKGRVLFETLIYKQEDYYLIECDNTAVSSLQKHLKMFKLRKKITIEDINNDVKLFVLTQSSDTTLPFNILNKDNVNFYNDPRLSDLGCRVIAPSSLAVSEVASVIGNDISIRDNEDEYKYFRYGLGVSEGVTDVTPGTSFPLEANCDYLHGVSFHKGCYIGQELTARTYHTGVIRKRLMPLKFTEPVQDEIQTDTVITSSNNPKSNIGKIKGFIRDHGLALVRIKEALDAESLVIGKYTAKVIKPKWWPVEAPKEKLNVSKIS